jgi:hypothetical protein
MEKELEAALNEVPVAGYVEEIGDIEPRKVLRLDRYLNTVHAHIAVSDTSEDIYYHKKFRERVPLRARRFLAFVLGRFSDKEKKEYLGYTKYFDQTDGLSKFASSTEEICLVPIESIEDYFTLTEGMKVVTY